MGVTFAMIHATMDFEQQGVNLAPTKISYLLNTCYLKYLSLVKTNVFNTLLAIQ